jgi:hypothetical protein
MKLVNVHDQYVKWMWKGGEAVVPHFNHYDGGVSAQALVDASNGHFTLERALEWSASVRKLAEAFHRQDPAKQDEMRRNVLEENS